MHCWQLTKITTVLIQGIPPHVRETADMKHR